MLLVITAALATAPAVYFSLRPVLSVTEIYIAVGAMGDFMLGLYSQCVAHVNDHLKSSQIVSAAGALVLTYGIGYAITPVLIGFLLPISPRFFFWVNGACAGSLAIFVLYRMTRRKAVEDQGGLVPVSTASPYVTVMSAPEEWGNESLSGKTESLDASGADVKNQSSDS